MRRFGLGTVVAAMLLVALPAVAAADTFTVNDDDAPGDAGPGGTCGPRDHESINDAIAAASDDDVIRVCAGTYEEAIETSGNFTFLGAQAGVDARTRSVPETDESIITTNVADGLFDVSGSVEATVDGFTLTTNPAGPAVRTGDATTVVNNIISATDGGVVGDGGAATIRRNHLTDTNGGLVGTGIALGVADFSVIDDNLIDTTDPGFASIVVGFDGPAGENITITDNESIGAGGIVSFIGFDVEIARNVVTDPFASEAGGIAIVSSVDVDVTRNTVDNPSEFTGGVSLFNSGDGPNQFIDITRNTLLGDGDDAGILVGEAATVEDTDAHFNRIVGHEVGLFVSDFQGVDATNNWWGCNGGPEEGECDPILLDLAFADFDPWLTLSAAADPESISAGGATSTITADLLTNSDGETLEGDFPDGTQIDFATDLGAVDPLFDLTSGAVANTTLTSGDQTGTANVDSTLDNETVTTEVEITEESLPPECTERIDGTAQNDNLSGTEGSELIRGRGGRDRVDGLGGDDCAKGGAGPDKVIGGPGEDRVRGGAGDDKVKARDGESDVVRCGAGDDVAKVNPGDNVKGCEEVKRG